MEEIQSGNLSIGWLVYVTTIILLISTISIIKWIKNYVSLEREEFVPPSFNFTWKRTYIIPSCDSLIDYIYSRVLDVRLYSYNVDKIQVHPQTRDKLVQENAVYSKYFEHLPESDRVKLFGIDVEFTNENLKEDNLRLIISDHK